MKYGSFDEETPALASSQSSSSLVARDSTCRSMGQLGHGVSRPKSMTSLTGERSVVRRSQSQANLAAGAAVVGGPGGAVAELLLRRGGQTSLVPSSTGNASDLPK